MNSFHTSYLEISKSALKHNLDFLRDFINDGVEISSVVKGNAYGHGIEQFVPLAEECGIRRFAVFSAEEALRVRNSGNGQCTLMIMGYVEDDQIEWAISHDVEFYVFEHDRLKKALTIAKKLGKKAKLHVEVETGMNRTGFEMQELPAVLNLLSENQEHLEFTGLCTHFAGSESIANYYRIKTQQSNFRKAVTRVRRSGLAPKYKHTACSAATLRYPKTQMDMVRLGIVQYGFFPTREVLVEYLSRQRDKENPLKRLISWKSRIMDIKNVKTGEFVGYGTSYLATSDIRVATIPVGYANGFSRALSNQGRVLIRGMRTSVLGMINMSMVTVDVTEIEGVEKGDEVVLIGRQGDLEITVSSFSEFSVQVNYEMLTRLPTDIPRIVVD